MQFNRLHIKLTFCKLKCLSKTFSGKPRIAQSLDFVVLKIHILTQKSKQKNGFVIFTVFFPFKLVFSFRFLFLKTTQA